MHSLIAYIDAGTGSMIVQVVIASLVAIPFFLRTQIARGARFVRSRFSRAKERPSDIR